MRRLVRAIGALALTLCAGSAVALAPAAADAQGKGRKSGHHNDKEYRKELKRQYKEERREDRRAVARWRGDDRDRRYATGRPDRYATRNRAVTTGRYRSSAVPRGHLPPPGLCRIWIDGVPPGRQPRPTDCATARRNRPANARILYGGGVRRDRDHDDRRGPVYDQRDTRQDVRYPVDTRTRDPQVPFPRRPLPLP
jgi:hypothetical protein